MLLILEHLRQLARREKLALRDKLLQQVSLRRATRPHERRFGAGGEALRRGAIAAALLMAASALVSVVLSRPHRPYV